MKFTARRRVFTRLDKITPEAIADIGERAFRDYLTLVSKRMESRHGNDYPGGTGKGSLSRRSGRTLDRVTSPDVDRTPTGVQATYRLDRGMAQQEFGGTIRANGSKYLAIPLPAALNHDGTPKRRGPGSWKVTYVVKGRRGLVVMQKRGGRSVPLYALRESARIPARLGLRRELAKHRPFLTEQFRRNIRALVEAN